MSTSKFAFKKDKKSMEQYQGLYSQLYALHQLENLYSSGHIMKEERKGILKDILGRIKDLKEILDLLDDSVIKFAEATNLPTFFIKKALLAGEDDEIDGEDIKFVCQKLGNEIVNFSNLVYKFNFIGKGDMQSSWKKIENCLKRLKLMEKESIQNIVLDIERIFTQHPDSNDRITGDEHDKLIMKTETLKSEIKNVFPSSDDFSPEDASKFFECGIKQENFFSTLLYDDEIQAEIIKNAFKEYELSISKNINLNENKGAKEILDKYRTILDKYKPDDSLSNEDKQEILQTKEDLYEYLYGDK